MNLDKVAERILKSRVYPHVNDLLDEGFEHHPDLYEIAKRVARTFTLKPVMRADEITDNGMIVYSPHNLIFSSYKIDTEDFDDNHLFIIDHVRSKEMAEQVKIDLKNGNEHWNLDYCVDSLWSGNNTAVIRTIDEQEKTTGMVAFRRTISVDVYDDDIVLLYQVTPELVFVDPSHRGKWLSSALRRAIVDQISLDTEKIAAHWNSGKIQKIAPVKLHFSVNAEAHTDEGERFAFLLGSNMEDVVNESFTQEQLDNDFFFKDGPVDIDCCR